MHNNIEAEYRKWLKYKELPSELKSELTGSEG